MKVMFMLKIKLIIAPRLGGDMLCRVDEMNFLLHSAAGVCFLVLASFPCLTWLPLHAVIRVCQVNHWMAEVRVGSCVKVERFSRQCVKHVQVVLIHCVPLSSTVAGSLSRRSGEIRLLCPPPPFPFPPLLLHPLHFTLTHHSCTFLPLIQTYPALLLLPLFTRCTWFPIILL